MVEAEGDRSFRLRCKFVTVIAHNSLDYLHMSLLAAVWRSLQGTHQRNSPMYLHTDLLFE